MSNNIRVMVEYEAPKKDKFLEMLAQYEEIKQTAADAVSYYRPLAEAAEEAKMAAILEQLKTIIHYLQDLYTISRAGVEIELEMPNLRVLSVLSIRYDSNMVRIRWRGNGFSMEEYKSRPHYYNATYGEQHNILGNWDKWQVYERLEQQCLSLLKAKIDKQKKMAEDEKARLANIVGE